MDGLQLRDGDLGVDGGCLQLLVSKQLLDKADVGTVFEHVRGAGVAQQVAASMLGESGFPERGRDLTAEHVGVEGLAVAG